MAGAAGRVALFKGIGALFERLPLGVDVAVASAAARLYGRLNAGARERLAKNLRVVLETDDEALVSEFVARGFSNYGRYWAEGAKLPAMSQAAIDRRFVIAEGRHYLDDARERGRGTIVALPHVGSWEWGGSHLASLGMPMTAVAERLEPPALFEWFREKRRAIGIEIAPLDDAAGRVLLEVLRAGGVVGLLCDRDLVGNGVEVEFFGHRTTLPAGPATLALRTGATLVTAACYSGPGRDHHAVVCAPVRAEREGRLRDDVARVTQLIAHDLESLIRRAPEQWHVLEDRFG